jgi:hypothetical protein
MEKLRGIDEEERAMLSWGLLNLCCIAGRSRAGVENNYFDDPVTVTMRRVGEVGTFEFGGESGGNREERNPACLPTSGS